MTDACLKSEMYWFSFFEALKSRSIARQCQPIKLSDLEPEPEPDVYIASVDSDDHGDRRPSPGDIFVVFEVAQSTFLNDSTIKLESLWREKDASMTESFQVVTLHPLSFRIVGPVLKKFDGELSNTN